MTGFSSGLCVVTQILEWKHQSWEFWVEVARALERQGQTLLILSPYDPPNGAAWPKVLPIPYAIGQFSGRPEASFAFDERLTPLLGTDGLFRTFLPPCRPAGKAELASAQAFFQAVLEELEPDVVMAWAPPLPQSLLFMEEARRLEVPVYALELGFLPRTLMLERHDIGFGSDLLSHPALVSALEHHVPDLCRVEALRAYYRAGTEGRATAAGTGGPTVAFLGSCPGYNLLPRESRSISLASPWFATFAEAFEAFRAALPAGVRVLARPHPADMDGLAHCRATSPPVEMACEGPILDLVDRVDAVAVLGDTRTQYEAALLGKPLVLLSRSPLWGKGIAYEWDGSGHLGEVAAQALAHVGQPDRKAATDRFFSFLAQHCLYGYHGAPLDRGPETLARSLKQFHLPAPGSTAEPGIAKRMDAFVRRTSPLIAPYVCREVASGARSLTEPLLPYAEAQVADRLLQEGVYQAGLVGSGLSAQRIAGALQDRGIQVLAFLDSDPGMGGRSFDGIPVRSTAWSRFPGPTALVVATSGEPGPLPPAPGARWEGSCGFLDILRAVPCDLNVWANFSSLARPGRVPQETVWMAMAMHHFDAQQWDDCQVCLRQAMDLRPAWSEPIHFLGLLGRAKGAPPAEVMGILLEALEREDPTPELFIDAGFSAFALQSWDLASGYAAQALERRPGWALPLHLLALTGKRQGVEPAAISQRFEQALEGTPVTAELLFDAALNAQCNGALERAADLAARAQALAPRWENAKRLVATLRSQAGNPEP